MTCYINNWRSFYRLIIYYINKNIYCKSSVKKSLMEFLNLNKIKKFLCFHNAGRGPTLVKKKKTEYLFLIFVNANYFIYFF